MTGRMGDIDGTELWLRCPFCGDSTHDPTKAHLSINLKRFVYHCFRCNASGALTAKQAFQLVSQLSGDFDLTDTLTEEDKSDSEWPALLPGAGLPRKSLLERHHYVDQNKASWDAFEMKHPKDNTVCGIHLRNQRHRLTLGDRGMSWPGSDRLISTLESPVRVVEGPYDVVYPKDICIYGLITHRTLRDLSGHYLILCPDGDVWENLPLFRTTILTIINLLKDKSKYFLGFEYLPDGKDPDEVPEKDRVYVPRNQVIDFIQNLPLAKKAEGAA